MEQEKTFKVTQSETVPRGATAPTNLDKGVRQVGTR